MTPSTRKYAKFDFRSPRTQQATDIRPVSGDPGNGTQGQAGIRLWNLEEFMRHYNVWQLAVVIAFWKEAECAGLLWHGINEVQRQSSELIPLQLIEKCYQPMLLYTVTELSDLELVASLDRCNKLHICLRDGITWGELRNQAKVLRETIDHELRQRRFAYVPTARALLHDKRGLTWQTVWERFPEVREDTERGIDCYALEQNTACIFHFMRVAEIGLRAIAKKLRVALKDKGKPMPVEFATWDKVITEIRNKIQDERQKAKTARRNEQLQFYSDVAEQCSYIRDLWRNEVSHTRKHYVEGEALAVMTRVHQFMELLAKSL